MEDLEVEGIEIQMLKIQEEDIENHLSKLREFLTIEMAILLG
jgi:hypothetical protein